jgi:hypothetical protein
MSGPHEPRDEFIRALESRVGAAARHRGPSADVPRWIPRSRPLLALVLIGGVAVSMAIGGTAVAVAYQAQGAEARQMLEMSYKQRAALAREQQALAMKLLQAIQQRVAMGAASTMELLDGQTKVATADAELRSVELQVEEVRLTGHEPVTQVSAPLVNGRDFVSERWRIELSVPAAAFQAEQARMKSAEARVAVGMTDTFEIEPIRARLKEIEFAIDGYRRKLDFRQKFLNKSIDAGLADLRVMEVDADQRMRILVSKIQLGLRELDRLKARVAVGAAQSLEFAAAELELRQMDVEASKAQYDLALIRQKIAERGR